MDCAQVISMLLIILFIVYFVVSVLIRISGFQPFVRREACMGLYRLCLGRTADSKTGYTLLIPMLSSMLSYLNEALTLKPPKNIDVS